MKCHGLVRLLYVVVLLARPVNAVEANATSAEDEETLAAPEIPCPVPCICTAELEADCSSISLQRLPQDLTEQLLKLDLSRNNISVIPDEAFLQLEYLVELNLAGNHLKSLSAYAFEGLKRLKELSLQDNSLTAVPWEAMEPLESLEILRLDGNKISNISSSVFVNITHLHSLWLGRNQLSQVPTLALSSLENLKALDLGGNNIAELGEKAFQNLTNLELLILKGNKISNVSDNAFQGLHKLQILEINENRLTKVPAAIESLPNLQELTIASNIIRTIDNNTFRRNPALTLIEMKGNPLQVIGHSAFANMPQLKKLFISEVKTLSLFPNLNGSETLEFLHIDRTSLSAIPNDLCRVLKKLKSIFVLNNQISIIPNLTECHNLLSLDISLNRIQEIGSSLFESLTQLHDVNVAFNQIEYIPADAFMGLESLKILNLANNKINYIHPDAFLPLKKLDDLNLGNNQFSHLPAQGLENVRTLDTSGNIYLKEFPSPSAFPHIKSLTLSYAYHCCEFLPLAEGGSAPVITDEIILWPSEDKKVDMRMWNNTDLWPAFENLTSRFGEFAEEIWGNFGPDYTYPYNFPQYIEDYLEEDKNQQRADGHKERHPVHCLPQPGPFMPCEDLFDWWTLRCGIWIVFLLAMLGNGTVVFVLVFSRSKMDVPRFLVCNLAVSDFFMGIYLGFLAVVDASTLGQFKMHAIGWQTSSACQIAGFLGVLSSELSVYTLAVITMERNYAITHAMHLNKRLSIKQAAYIMACGWAFALIMASLPVFGISDYSKFAVCLPFEIGDSWSLAYVVFLMSVNGVAFLILMGCYLKMYCAIRGSQAWNSNDSRIAKRMALLVFTDFICWAPIAFFSLTAAFGLQLISLEEAKVFTIFVLPLNSCANPFLYAILTKQFKKDCVLICKAIEESRVTRGIGRCRHSSNFSNRQTPANTNSVIDRNSSNNGQVCSCNLKSGDSDKPMPKPWRLSKVRYLLCDAGETEQDSSNDYAYTLADIQRSQQKHKRNSSVSSENFSSSRSDSWRNRSIPLRLLDRHRRNSWTITRKPSQDSNLSNSRNDSSATTASTSTWRISRSSVSSDSSAAPRSSTYSAKPGGATVTMPNSGVEQRYPSFRQKDHGSPVPNPIPNRALPPTAVRPRPKLTRQVAISDESWAAAHGTQEDPCAEDSVYLPPPPQTVVPERVEGGPEGQLSVGFVPRKLSTISSRSCSINRENSYGPGGALSIEDPLQRLSRTADNQPSSSSEDEVFDSSLPERNRLLLLQNEPPRSDSAKETQPLVNSES